MVPTLFLLWVRSPEQDTLPSSFLPPSLDRTQPGVGVGSPELGTLPPDRVSWTRVPLTLVNRITHTTENIIFPGTTYMVVN